MNSLKTKFLFLKTSLKEKLIPPRHNGLPIPPIGLRYLSVCHKYGREVHIESGQHCAEAIKKIAKEAGKDIWGCEKVLEFGSGCGRVIRHLYDPQNVDRLYGTDVDLEATNWCTEKIGKIASFSKNGYSPPLAYEPNIFDLIYSISVFTHLDEPHQFLWLQELQRVAKPDAIIILTVNNITKQNFGENIKNQGFFVKERTSEVVRRGWIGKNNAPTVYYDSYHSREYIQSLWSKYFDILDYCPKAITPYQDAVVLRVKRSASPHVDEVTTSAC